MLAALATLPQNPKPSVAPPFPSQEKYIWTTYHKSTSGEQKTKNGGAAGAAPGKNGEIAAAQAPPQGKIEQIAAPQALTF
eukprot:gene22330-biopygen10242